MLCACVSDIESDNVFPGFLFGLIAGGINNTGAVWGATDSWPTIEMQARYVHCLLVPCFVKLKLHEFYCYFQKPCCDYGSIAVLCFLVHCECVGFNIPLHT